MNGSIIYIIFDSIEVRELEKASLLIHSTLGFWKAVSGSNGSLSSVYEISIYDVLPTLGVWWGQLHCQDFSTLMLPPVVPSWEHMLN